MSERGGSRLSAPAACATVAPMATPRSRQTARLRARRRRSQRRAQRLAVLVIVGCLAFVTLVLTAFGSGTPRQRATGAAPAFPAVDLRPAPQVLATVGNLRIQVPVARDALTAIGFHGSRSGALALQPVGRQANSGLLARLWRKIVGPPKEYPVWYQLGGGGPGTSALDVGAPRGTVVYAPVDGSVASMTDFVVDGRKLGKRIEIRPGAAPAMIVSLTHLRPDPSLSVGSPVLAGATKVGTVLDVAAVERQSLARHASDRGNNVAIEVHPAAGSLP